MNRFAPPRPPTGLAPPPGASPVTSPAAPNARLPRWASRLGALAVTGFSLAYDAGVVLILPLLFVLVVPFEKLAPRHRGQRLRRPLAMLDIRYALTTAVAGIAGIAVGVFVGIVSLAWLPGLALRPLVAMIPPGIAPFVGIALFDLAIYWAHRWSHEVPALWRFHAIHHSTEHLDWISGFRSHPFDGAIVAPPVVFLLAAGFDPTFTGVLAVVQFVTGLFLHANVRWRWKPLHRVVITPEFHHWHHGYEQDAHNSNYSVFLPLWDIVFGTYYMPGDKRPARYGVDLDVPPTMRGQLAFPFRGVRSIRQMARHPRRGLGAAVRVTRGIAREVWRSTTRPRARTQRGVRC
jgi:sterol desaturase/sphingolipid hydroxylase (fatty acid hydroxylase superfamily)